MAQRYLIDTSVVIKYLNGSLVDSGLIMMDRVVDEESNLSFISEIELQVWNPKNPDDIIVYQDFVANSIVLGIDDAIIAATCIVNKLTLVADNDKDFQKVKTMKVINPNNS